MPHSYLAFASRFKSAIAPEVGDVRLEATSNSHVTQTLKFKMRFRKHYGTHLVPHTHLAFASRIKCRKCRRLFGGPKAAQWEVWGAEPLQEHGPGPVGPYGPIYHFMNLLFLLRLKSFLTVF